jgi:hypothetical protein
MLCPTPPRPKRQDAAEPEGQDTQHGDERRRTADQRPYHQGPAQDHEAGVEPPGTLLDLGQKVVDQVVQVVPAAAAALAEEENQRTGRIGDDHDVQPSLAAMGCHLVQYATS